MDVAIGLETVKFDAVVVGLRGMRASNAFCIVVVFVSLFAVCIVFVALCRFCVTGLSELVIRDCLAKSIIDPDRDSDLAVTVAGEAFMDERGAVIAGEGGESWGTTCTPLLPVVFAVDVSDE